MGRQIGQAELFAQHIVEPPAGLDRIAQHVARREARRRGETRSQATLAIAADDRVDGQRDRIEFRVARRVEHRAVRSEEHTSELQSLMRISYAVFCLKKKKITKNNYSAQ